MSIVGAGRGLLSLVAALVAVAVIGLAGCDSAPPPDPGHERMRLAIAEIASRTPDENPWLGDRAARELRELVAQVDSVRPQDEVVSLHLRLGVAELRLGNDAEAIEHMETARSLLLEARGGPNEEYLANVDHVLGVAHLRIAETCNCVARHTNESCLLPIRGAGVHIERKPSTSAIAAFERVLGVRPNHVPARWLLNIAYMTVGRHPDGVPAEHLIPPAAYESETEFPRFVGVAADVGLATRGLSGSVVLEDLDGDDLIDVFVTSWDPTVDPIYFRNRGDGGFDDRAASAGLQGLGGCLNVVHADYDGDGDADLLLLRGAWLGKRGRHPNSLLQNDGTGRFTDVTFAAGLGRVHYPTQTACWADYDGDGDLDLFVGNESSPELWAPSQLFRNGGDGTFVDVAVEAGVTNGRYTKGATWGDYDGDGDPDLYLSNIYAKNRLYRNDGDGTFTDVAEELGVTGPERSFPAWFWDFDNDGSLDILATAYESDWITSPLGDMVAHYLGMATDAEPPRLYRGAGNGRFEDVGRSRGLTRPSLPMGANFGDLDNDGYLDFYLGTGDPILETITPNVMFHNEAGRRFRDVSAAGGFGHLQKGHGIAFADLDNDGDLDVFEVMGGAFPTDVFVNALYENPGFGNHWLTVRLVGTTSNRSAIGARIMAEFEDEGRRRRVYRHVTAGGSFGSNPLQQTLGLAGADTVRLLEIHWPTTGETQRFRDVAADQFVELVEGGSLRRFRPTGFELDGR